MKLLFVHQDMPGQFKHLAPALARMPGNQVVFLTKRTDAALPHVNRLTYAAPRAASPDTHHYIRLYEDAVLHGQQAARLCLQLKSNDFIPDVVIAHPGWGEALFIKDIFPKTRVLSYCEFYYQGIGSDIGFDPESPSSLDTICQARARNAHLLLSLELC
ncbi:MAG: glycosyl transferase family 1, partial [Blastocatellia bacterium]|nr:glycosyl transferase family 1 [Blastocatellia bacterium]